jgi:hypothetical protein
MEGFEKFKKDTYDLCILDMMPYKRWASERNKRKNSEVLLFLLQNR